LQSPRLVPASVQQPAWPDKALALALPFPRGFEIGTLPGAFSHPSRGDVDAFVMYRQLHSDN
jgi:hypothetical protein